MTTIDRDRDAFRYAGGMRIIEALRYGLGIADTLDDLARGWESPGGQDAYCGAVENLASQYLAIRNAGLKISHPTARVHAFLMRPPVAMAHELTRLLNGGAATQQEFSECVSALVSAVESQRACFTRNGKPLALACPPN